MERGGESSWRRYRRHVHRNGSAADPSARFSASSAPSAVRRSSAPVALTLRALPCRRHPQAGAADLRRGARSLDQQRGRAARPPRRGDSRAARGHARPAAGLGAAGGGVAGVRADRDPRRGQALLRAQRGGLAGVGRRRAGQPVLVADARREHAVDAGGGDARGEPQDPASAIAPSGRNGTRSRPRASWRRSGASARSSRPT